MEILAAPNLISLSRVCLAPIAGYFLFLSDSNSSLIALSLIILAGITDGLDGYLARRLDRITPLGVALDPIADKLFAAILVVSLILFRGFPYWLATAILGRDMLILLGGLIIRRKHEVILPSNLTGKYTFAVIAVLLGSYVITFEFGIAMMTVLTVIMTIASLVSYGRVFQVIFHGGTVAPFQDTTVTRVIRLGVTVTLSVWFLVRLYLDRVA
jgi:cardiolipin synthase